MFKKVISVLVLFLYLHGMSGYTMSIHKCTITGSQNIYTGFNNADPCGDEEEAGHDEGTNTDACIERADCCAMENTVINIDDESNISTLKISFIVPFISSFIPAPSREKLHTISLGGQEMHSLDPPGPEELCIFRI